MKALSLLFFCLLMLSACSDPRYEVAGTLTETPRPAQTVKNQQQLQQDVSRSERQILFGDLHVHTSFSTDAFQQSLSFSGGEGARPPAQACDFARFCSQLDFWSLNDHASALTPDRWQASKESVRQCNKVSDPTQPDTVAFTGWEWTHVGGTPQTHWGHKNIIFPGIEEDELPSRAISALKSVPDFQVPYDIKGTLLGPLKAIVSDGEHRRDHWAELLHFYRNLSVPACEEGLAATLPNDCSESAADPSELFARLDAWGLDYMVIPHGTSWGLYTPPGSSWNKQLQGDMHNGARQNLIEVYSGHGNSEEYRSWRAVDIDGQGNKACPMPAGGYLPCCWQAGEIVRQQCQAPDSAECEQQVQAARQNAVDAASSGQLTLTNVRQEDWLNCGQCDDCFLPAFNLRPGTSVQAAVAQGEFSDGKPRHVRFGFNIDTVMGPGQPAIKQISGPIVSIRPEHGLGNMQTIFNRERGASMLYTGGLVAVHSEGRRREEIWQALKRNEVYGTSGPRILLWFNLVDHQGELKPMGSELSLGTEPVFRVKAVAARKQSPGCPQFAEDILGQERLQKICGGECYHPANERQQMDRIEIIKILPQQSKDENLADLIVDPWRVLPCDVGSSSCEAEFSDPDYVAGGRTAVYYARAIQQPEPTINGAGLNCQRNAAGECETVDICYANRKTPWQDDCLAPVSHRAWSSPIYLDPPGSQL
jgi:hypothetical protein